MSDIKLTREQKREEKKYFKEHTIHIKLTPGDIIFNIINYAFFIVFTISCIFPFYYLFINTISDNELVTKGAITLLPKGLTISNYIQMGKVNDLWNSVLITFLRTFIGTALMVFISALAGYLVTKKEMWHRQFWYRFLVITMYFNAGLIPWYLNMSTLGLTDTFAAYIIPGIVSPYNIILVKTYIESIPGEIEESAYMDGASYWTIFRKIIWPLSKPILATIAIFGAVGHWNSFQDSLILNANSPQLFTLQHRLYIYLQKSSNISAMVQSGISSADTTAIAGQMNTKIIQYTISMVTIIPILCVYPFMQRYFEKGLMLGAVKG
ncbi:MAG: carbohydrate ABC transporter permease [Oscillospiraceae bacterium]|nr:carbohydrate ABC transporter permease [Oscillospiraceae bacterium]